jgi:hypothetical protein
MAAGFIPRIFVAIDQVTHTASTSLRLTECTASAVIKVINLGGNLNDGLR